ncbi:MAG TPA: response regulator [Nitrososphaeraceae archaeon]|nr:response regulator [Nitrososphaeraceae archaeon]
MDLPSATIAVVDDDVDSLNLFTEIIQENGYIVVGFTNPSFLIDYIHEHDQIKFILLDYKIREMTGSELADKIHALNPNIKMAFVTGYDHIINNTLNLEIFRKPLPLRQLIDIVDSYMQQQAII